MRASQRRHQLEAQLAREAGRAVRIGHAHHEAAALRRPCRVGGLGQPGEQPFALVLRVRGRVQRQQAGLLHAVHHRPQGDGDVVRRQRAARPGIEAYGGTIGVVHVLPAQHLRGEVPGLGEHGAQQVRHRRQARVGQVQRAQLVGGAHRGQDTVRALRLPSPRMPVRRCRKAPDTARRERRRQVPRQTEQEGIPCEPGAVPVAVNHRGPGPTPLSTERRMGRRPG